MVGRHAVHRRTEGGWEKWAQEANFEVSERSVTTRQATQSKVQGEQRFSLH